MKADVRRFIHTLSSSLDSQRTPRTVDSCTNRIWDVPKRIYNHHNYHRKRVRPKECFAAAEERVRPINLLATLFHDLEQRENSFDISHPVCVERNELCTWYRRPIEQASGGKTIAPRQKFGAQNCDSHEYTNMKIWMTFRFFRQRSEWEWVGTFQFLLSGSKKKGEGRIIEIVDIFFPSWAEAVQFHFVGVLLRERNLPSSYSVVRGGQPVWQTSFRTPQFVWSLD